MLHYWLLESSSSRRVKVVVVAVPPALLLALVVRLERVIPELLKGPHACSFACWLPALPFFLPSLLSFQPHSSLTQPQSLANTSKRSWLCDECKGLSWSSPSRTPAALGGVFLLGLVGFCPQRATDSCVCVRAPAAEKWWELGLPLACPALPCLH